jgi:hypothetical protein
VVVWQEAINCGDIDGAIITGAAHSATIALLTSNLFYPTANDPIFAGQGLDAGYLTTVPDTRAGAFYSSPDDDPAVIAKDDQHKDVVAGPELMTGLPAVTSTASRAIRVPVLDILGSHDFTTCGPNPQGTPSTAPPARRSSPRTRRSTRPRPACRPAWFPARGTPSAWPATTGSRWPTPWPGHTPFVGQHRNDGQRSDNPDDRRLPSNCS